MKKNTTKLYMLLIRKDGKPKILQWEQVNNLNKLIKAMSLYNKPLTTCGKLATVSPKVKQ